MWGVRQLAGRGGGGGQQTGFSSRLPSPGLLDLLCCKLGLGFFAREMKALGWATAKLPPSSKPS